MAGRRAGVWNSSSVSPFCWSNSSLVGSDPPLWRPQRWNRRAACACSDVATAEPCTARMLDPPGSWHFLGHRVFIWDIWRSLPALPAPLALSVALSERSFAAACCCCCRCCWVLIRSESTFEAWGDKNYWPEKMNGKCPTSEKVDLNKEARGVRSESRRTAWTATVFQPWSPGNEADIFPDLLVFFSPQFDPTIAASSEGLIIQQRHCATSHFLSPNLARMKEFAWNLPV